jgi:hypothetical protein
MSENSLREQLVGLIATKVAREQASRPRANQFPEN